MPLLTNHLFKLKCKMYGGDERWAHGLQCLNTQVTMTFGPGGKGSALTVRPCQLACQTLAVRSLSLKEMHSFLWNPSFSSVLSLRACYSLQNIYFHALKNLPVGYILIKTGFVPSNTARTSFMLIRISKPNSISDQLLPLPHFTKLNFAKDERFLSWAYAHICI